MFIPSYISRICVQRSGEAVWLGLSSIVQRTQRIFWFCERLFCACSGAAHYSFDSVAHFFKYSFRHRASWIASGHLIFREGARSLCRRENVHVCALPLAAAPWSSKPTRVLRNSSQCACFRLAVHRFKCRPAHVHLLPIPPQDRRENAIFNGEHAFCDKLN